MSRPEVSRRIASIIGDIHRLTQGIAALQSICITDNPGAYSDFSQQTALLAEVIALRLRRIVYDTANRSKSDYLLNAADELDITVSEHDGIVDISLPCLLPKRSKRAADFIAGPLFATLDDLTSGRQPPFVPFTHCVICITHIYDKTLPTQGRIRDHDNVELKGIIDTINTFLLTDDAGNLCDIFSTSEVGETDYTRISIMEKNRFPTWVLGYENTPKTISHFQ